MIRGLASVALIALAAVIVVRVRVLPLSLDRVPESRRAVAAYDTVLALAPLDRETARAYLLARGLDADAADDMLASTHCTPPPTYLLLSSLMAAKGSWSWIGSWDPRRDGAGTARPDPACLLPQWSACTETGDGAWSCPPVTSMRGRPQSIDAVELRPDAPTRTRVRTAGAERIPAVVLLAGADSDVQEVATDPPHDDQLAVLIDVPGRRVLAGSPDLLRSTFTRLLFLDARFMPGFQLVDDRTGYGDERVRTWRVR